MSRLIVRRTATSVITSLLVALASTADAQTPAAKTPIYTSGKLTADQQQTREIFKELIEINTSVTTGNITNGAIAMAKRFRAAGIPDSDIFVGGPRPERVSVRPDSFRESARRRCAVQDADRRRKYPNRECRQRENAWPSRSRRW